MGLFPRWSNGVLGLCVVLGAGAAFGVPVLLMIGARTPYVTGQYRPVEQPVQFDHRHHTVDDGIDCRYCHDLVERAPSAGVPPTSRCVGCHSQIWNDSPLLDAVWESQRTGAPIRWRRVHRLPDFVFFDHAAHVHVGVGCETCHGRVDRMARVHQEAPLTMGWCLDCHRDPEPHLRPREHVTAMGWEPEEPGVSRAELGAQLRARYGVEPGTDCTTCHR